MTLSRKNINAVNNSDDKKDLIQLFSTDINQIMRFNSEVQRYRKIRERLFVQELALSRQNNNIFALSMRISVNLKRVAELTNLSMMWITYLSGK